jgi:hypothetical protein
LSAFTESDTAVRHDRALQRRIGLQADDDFTVEIDVAGGVGGDGARHLRDVEHAFLALLDEQCLHRRPEVLRSGRGWREESLVAVVGLIVGLDEIADVDVFIPEAGLKPVPLRCGLFAVRCRGCN